jgi:hypothetical protein
MIIAALQFTGSGLDYQWIFWEIESARGLGQRRCFKKIVKTAGALPGSK